MGKPEQLERCLSREACPVVYGPNDTVRFGRSLGLNLGDPARKICSWSCDFCQDTRGKSDHDSAVSGRMASVDEVISEVREAFRLFPNTQTLVIAGNGEPTLNPRFAEIVSRLRELRASARGQWRLLCLTNASQFAKADVLEACQTLDETWVRLDCADPGLFKEFCRPPLSVTEHLAQIAKLRAPRIQTFLWRARKGEGQQNWYPENLQALVAAYEQIKPAEIHVTTARLGDPFSPVLPVPFEDLNAFVLRVEECGFSATVV